MRTVPLWTRPARATLTVCGEAAVVVALAMMTPPPAVRTVTVHLRTPDSRSTKSLMKTCAVTPEQLWGKDGCESTVDGTRSRSSTAPAVGALVSSTKPPLIASTARPAPLVARRRE